MTGLRAGRIAWVVAGWLCPLLMSVLTLGVSVALADGNALNGEGSPGSTLPSVADPGYQLGPEDVIEISVWKEDGMKKEVLVRPDGGISFPLVGELVAAGRTAEEIRLEIESRLRSSINDPVVTVGVLRVAANKVYVIGKVGKPGEFPTGRYVDVLQALSMAGGLTPFAAENDIRIIRRIAGREQQFSFRYADIRKGRNLEQNIILRGGDVIVVP